MATAVVTAPQVMESRDGEREGEGWSEGGEGEEGGLSGWRVDGTVRSVAEQRRRTRRRSRCTASTGPAPELSHSRSTSETDGLWVPSTQCTVYSKLWNKAQGLDALGGCFALAAVEETSAVL